MCVKIPHLLGFPYDGVRWLTYDTATISWAMDVADKFPDAEVV